MDAMDITPASLKTERSVLGALLVTGQKQRDAVVAELQMDDFHDPLYRRLFAVMVRHRGSDPLPLFARPDRWEVCRLIMERDGSPRCGRVVEIAAYVEKLKSLAKMRTKLVWIMREYDRIRWRAERLTREGENDL